MYLPCWYEGLSWQEQYDCYWINGIIGKWDYLEEQRKYSFYSLLPLRFYDRDNRGYYIKPESAEKGNKTSSRYVYAFELWKTSCKYILSAMPDIEKIEFGEQQPNGIYPIKFRYPVEEVLMCQKDTMKKFIENGFPFNSEETAVMFKKGTHYSYEQCEEYYKIFDERILTISNQQRNYYSRNTNLDLAIKNKDIAEVKRIIKQGINLMVQFIKAIRYEEDCSEELSSFIGDDSAFEFSYYEKFHSAFLPGLMQMLIESGLDVNLLGKFGDVLHRILYLENGYTAADTFAVLFNNGLDVYTADDDGDSLFDTIDFDILFGMRNQYIRRRYDSWLHTWLVFVGYGVKLKNGNCPVDIVYEEDENSEFEIKDFEIEDLRNHYNYYFGISYPENRGDKCTIHIFDNRTRYEVARL